MLIHDTRLLSKVLLIYKVNISSLHLLLTYLKGATGGAEVHAVMMWRNGLFSCVFLVFPCPLLFSLLCSGWTWPDKSSNHCSFGSSPASHRLTKALQYLIPLILCQSLLESFMVDHILASALHFWKDFAEVFFWISVFGCLFLLPPVSPALVCLPAFIFWTNVMPDFAQLIRLLCFLLIYPF